MKAEDYMTPDEAHEIDGCMICGRLDCVCPPEEPSAFEQVVGSWENGQPYTLEQTESLSDWYDHTWAESPAIEIQAKDRYWEEETQFYPKDE